MKNTLKKISESDLYPDKAYYDLLGDSHVLHNINTPIRPDAFTLTDDEKIAQIELHFKAIMEILGLDLNDDSLCGTPYRVAKMYVKEFFQGLHPENKPSVTLFENTYNYKEILIERNISFHSNCEHHFVPITGKAHVAYIPKDKIIGLSKINRLVQYYARRPQVQERLTLQIANEMLQTLQTPDVAVLLVADHACVASRGVGDQQSSTVTAKYFGKFEQADFRNEFLRMIKIE
ncbi:MAG: GTP cyclohydrolase I FolE [Sphingobacteriales bacterium]|nr:GTP cyclohydrolase I FolE [Sphingobacteriales bacterium]MDA0197700.1 GTP cyclohydrolase I FolE [Bacteroidota bacterium]HMS53532.1 GTP cyclohydrolase I FolE [Chitinophagales bacterium]MBK6888798.1 GTP cyclohydrolase I FolE [Sphingobacteriales bacterium]MBK7528695.1 GTP cyclohydrolase I FolE [Sphingobacteriales bacterium]